MKSPKEGSDLTANIETIDLKKLVPDPANVRKHNERSATAVERSLKAFGAARSIVVDGKGIVRAGNQTLESAMKAGITRAVVIEADGKDLIVVKRKDWNTVDATAYAIADNRATDLSEFDNDALSQQLKALQADGMDMDLVGFDPDELQSVFTCDQTLAAGQCDPDEIPEPPDKAMTDPGDIWILGNHRLLCGDSSKPEDLDRLLDGATIHLVNTDPPYNVKVEPRSNNAIAAGLSSFQASNSKPQNHHQSFDVARQGPKKATSTKLRAKDRPLANDFVSDEAFDKMLDAWFGNLARVLAPGRGFYIWGGYANLGNYPPFLKRHHLYFSQSIVWDKEHPVLTRKDFMGAFELCFYGWKEGAGHKYFGPNNATDLWHVKKVNPQSMVHLTEKPVELAVRAIQYSSRDGENVLDLFGGSGSTLIAAEQTGRHAYLMELDTLYCDVIVQRWEKFTGKKAKRIIPNKNPTDAIPVGSVKDDG